MTNVNVQQLVEPIGVLNSFEEKFKPLKDYMEEYQIKPDSGFLLLQYRGFRDCDGNWSQELLDCGYITVTSYIGIESSCGLLIRCKNEFVGPHPGADNFFKNIFKTGW